MTDLSFDQQVAEIIRLAGARGIVPESSPS